MIRSMTAFARDSSTSELGELVWELRSVNHRYLESHLRLPEDMKILEPRVRERLGKRLGRGKLDVNLRFKPAAGSSAGLQINQTLVGQLLQAVAQIEKEVPDAPPRPMEILRWPGVLEPVVPDLSPVHEAAAVLLEQAIDELIQTREREGLRMKEVVQTRCVAMRQQVENARQRVPEVLEALRERLRTRLAEITDTLDSDRVEQEMVLLVQRLDVDEELDRLYAHLDEVEAVLERDEPVGRRLDFLMQELNREANTLGSKSADSETTAISVEMKVLIEQMREQVQNIE